MAQPVRSLRLSGRIASNLDRISGEAGEVFYDSTNKTVRVFTGSGSEHNIVSTRLWTNQQLTTTSNTLNASIALKAPLASPTFTGTLTAPTLVGALTGDVFASNGTTKILESGTNGSDAVFTGAVTGNVTGTVSSINNHSINALSDVDTATAAPTTGQSLVWNGTVWHPETVVGGGGGADLSTSSINALQDVDTVTAAPSLNNLLKWNGTNWVPGTITATDLSLGNVTNESKATMFASPTFTGTAALPAGSTIGGVAIANTGNVTFTGNTISTTSGNIAVSRLTTFSNGIGVTGTIAASINALSDVDTVTNAPTNGQVLKWNGTNWVPSADVTSGGAGTDAATFAGQLPAYYLSYVNLTGTPDLSSYITTTDLEDYAPLASPAFTGTVSFSGATSVTGITAASVGLGEVTNKSETSMFSNPTVYGNITLFSTTITAVTGTENLVLSNSPTFSGTVTLAAGASISGLTATSVGLGNVTNESKATMFANPTFTGTVSGVSKTAVGLSNVENTAISTFAGSTNIVTIGTLTNGLRVNSTDGIGYPNGQGGTATQLTNRTTAVTVNKLVGVVTLFSATAAQGVFSFQVNNNLVAVDDVIIVNTRNSGTPTNIYIPAVTRVQAGFFRISVYVPSAVGTADQPQINFFVLKGTAI
jgi:hypothetical protein